MARGTTIIYQSHFANDNFYFLNEDETRQYQGVTWRTMDHLVWERENVKTLILALDPNVHWQKEVPNCAVIQPDGPARVDADQYEIHWDDVNKVWYPDPTLRRPGGCSLSLKLALVTDGNGQAAGIVDMHFSGTK